MLSLFLCRSLTHTHTHTLEFIQPWCDLFDTKIPKSCAETQIPSDHYGPSEAGWHQKEALCFHDFSPPLSVSASLAVCHMLVTHTKKTPLFWNKTHAQHIQHEETKDSLSCNFPISTHNEVGVNCAVIWRGFQSKHTILLSPLQLHKTWIKPIFTIYVQ